MSYSPRNDYGRSTATCIRLTEDHRTQLFWERIDTENEVLLTGDRVVEVEKLTSRMSDAMRQGIIETGNWEPSPILPDISEIMRSNEEMMLEAMRFSRQVDTTTNMKRQEAEQFLKAQAARFGLTVVPLDLDPERGEAYETSNPTVIRQTPQTVEHSEPPKEKKLYGAAANAAKRKAVGTTAK